ncbi:transcriptional regulator [Candidatus Woesearchaeota archaeon CG10_big_fil_rev_8_21_14_0_10_37_12]|nr:MAG: transcriptional regulator [Candidatus Woesearchaeota archaeon CG10_big_fil_rev_8_21_14_0_10_37_12]
MQKSVLDLDVRKKIFQTVEAFPGSHFREIQRKTNLSTGSLQHHLNFLVRHGVLSEVKENNKVRYFPKFFSSDDKVLLGLLRQRSIRNILLFLLIKNKANHKAIAQFVKLSPSTISWHIKKLEEKGIIERNQNGKKTYYGFVIAKEKLVHLLIMHRESFIDKLVDNVCDMWLE